MPQDSAPKAFISYAWTNEEFRQWVIRLANDLRARGIDVVLDAWDLKPGHELYHFMEQCVSDPTVTHVLIVCNAAYAVKADGRTGGVGSEAQIITAELYGKTKNTKFIPVVAERDSNNTPHLPTFLKSIVHVDLSSEQIYFEGLDHLLRLLHGAPAFPKPPIGPKPSYLTESATTGSSTAALANSAMYALREGKPIAKSQARDYLTAVCKALGNLRVRHANTKELDDEVIDAIAVGKSVSFRHACLNQRPSAQVCALASAGFYASRARGEQHAL